MIVSVTTHSTTLVGQLEAEGRALEGARLRQRTTFDLEMLRELGYCSGVENYSRHLGAREPGSRPWTLLDYFPPDWLLIVDESHMTIPQVVGMYKNDRTRKEILVACDSPDPPRGLCKRYGAKLITFPERQGKAIALNKAAKHARGSILFSVDSDTVVAKDCLSQLVPWFADASIAAVAPRFLVHKPRTLFERLSTIEAAMNHSQLRTHMRFGTLLAFRGCGVALRASAFRRLGGWPTTLAEDIDFSHALLRNGHRIQYEPAALVSTRHLL